MIGMSPFFSFHFDCWCFELNILAICFRLGEYLTFSSESPLHVWEVFRPLLLVDLIVYVLRMTHTWMVIII